MNFGDAGEKLRRSTVQIRSGANSIGSGVVWNATGAIVTNAHVAGAARALTVEFWDGGKVAAVLEKRDLRRDLAILRLNRAGALQPALPGDSGKVRVGEFVMAVGNPLGFTGALSTGVVHGTGPIAGLTPHSFIQTTARLAPGNSGGPLADSAGRVIGINTMIVSGGLGLAVPSNAVSRLFSSSPPVELGVTLRPVRIPGASPGIALLVLEIAPGSPAEYASLRIGDTLVGCNGSRLHSVDALHEALEQASGGSLALQFLRGGETQRREVVVRLMQSGLAA